MDSFRWCKKHSKKTGLPFAWLRKGSGFTTILQSGEVIMCVEEQTGYLKKNYEKPRTSPITGEPGWVKCQPDNLLLLKYVQWMRTKSTLALLSVDRALTIVFKCLVGISKSPPRTRSFWMPFYTSARQCMTLWSKLCLRLKCNKDWVLIPSNSTWGNDCSKLPLWIILLYWVY